MPVDPIDSKRNRFSRSDVVVVVLLLVVAAMFRLPALDSPGYGLDELWTAEVASGRGSVHLDFPVDQYLKAPDIFNLAQAPPWWNVWTHMQVTHPPLYYILLRLWMAVFGQGDETERLFAVASALVAIVLLFDTARLTSGRTVAFWACLLFAVAPLQVDFARKTRNYALAVAILLVAANALIRIEKRGPNRWRLVGLFFGVLATPLTHYLSIGAVIGFFAYAVVRLKGRTRRVTLTVFLLSALVFATIWGPFFYQQRSLFAVDDPGVSFVKDAAPGHLMRVLDLFLMAPAKLLVPRLKLHAGFYAVALLYVIPLFVIRRRPDIFLWSLWLLGDIGGLAILDLTRSSLHLGFVRYIMMAGPGLYALIACVARAVRGPGWITHAFPAAVVVLCLCYVNDGYYDPAADPHKIIKVVQPNIGPQDVIVFASRGNLSWTRGVQAMMVIRYLRPVPCPILFLNGPPSEQVHERLITARSLMMFTSSDPPSVFVPEFSETASASFPSWGTVSLMKLNSSLLPKRKS